MGKPLTEAQKKANRELIAATKRKTFTVDAQGRHRDAQSGQFLGKDFNSVVRGLTGRKAFREDDADATN